MSRKKVLAAAILAAGVAGCAAEPEPVVEDPYDPANATLAYLGGDVSDEATEKQRRFWLKAWLTLARKHQEEGRWSESYRAARQALQVDPGNAQAQAHIRGIEEWFESSMRGAVEAYNNGWTDRGLRMVEEVVARFEGDEFARIAQERREKMLDSMWDHYAPVKAKPQVDNIKG